MFKQSYLEYIQLFDSVHDGRDDLNSTWPCSNDSHPFVPQVTMALPPGTVETLALEWLHPFKPWGLGVSQEPTSRYDMRADQNLVLATCPFDLNFPFVILLNPFGTVYRCWEPEKFCCFIRTKPVSRQLLKYLMWSFRPKCAQQSSKYASISLPGAYNDDHLGLM